MPPTSVGPYRVVRELGRGGMGVVFEVRDPAVAERRLALKLILPGAASDEALARFAREAQLLARVKHPNVVAIHAFARAPEGPYLVTDFVEGEPLERRAEWTPTAAATLVRTLCDAVAALHAQVIVHPSRSRATARTSRSQARGRSRSGTSTRSSSRPEVDARALPP